MQYRVFFKENGCQDKVIGTFNTRKKAIDEGSTYRLGHYSCDKESERRIGLELRGWCIVGYTSIEISIEEIE